MKTFYRLVLFLLLSGTVKTNAQDTLNTVQNSSFYDLSLEQLMNIHISVASVKELTARESPGIVSLITQDDIKNMGARDLMDVLRMVPGFDFGVDVEGVVGIGVRGNWAHEGKVLLLIDGQQMNENLYSNLQLGNHYPVDNIDRIEIIRGPGSAIYGGYAEYAVINIITIKAKDINGIKIGASYGQMNETYGHRNINISVGDEEKDFTYSFAAYFSQANRSEDVYTDVFGNSYNMKDESAIRNSYVNMGLTYKEYELRAIIDNYNLFTRDAYQEIFSKPYLNNFDSYFIELKRDYIINKKLTLTPKFNYKNQRPWSFDLKSPEDELRPYKVNSQRYTGTISLQYNCNDNISILTGAEAYKDIATQKLDEVFITNNSDKLSYENYAFFAQTFFKTKIVDITAGARYVINSRYDPSFVPRLGITRVFNRFHAKVLFSKAFRAPSTENIDLAIGIKPENTTVFEAETGYQLSDNMLLTLNAYDINTEDPIIYYYDEVNDNDAYANFDKTGTKGIEVEYKYKGKRGYASANYSFYSTSGKEIAFSYRVPQNYDALLAFPAHKANLGGGVKINEHLTINGSINFSGPRYGIVSIDELTNDTLVKKFDPYCLMNLNLTYDNLFVKGLNASVGVHNITGTKDVYIQPYNSLHAPLPANNREIMLKLSYNLKFKY